MMKLLSIAALLSLVAINVAGQSPVRVVDEIVLSIVRSGLRQPGGIAPRPLPLAGHWNLGEEKEGYTPEYQMRLIEEGHHLLPTFLLPNRYADPTDPRWLAYYEAAIKKAAWWGLPIALSGTQWESPLSNEDRFLRLPWAQNPNVVTAEGQIRREVSPFGPVEPWREVGREWGGSRMLRKLQEWYPNPPHIIFISNNEHSRLDWIKCEDDRRYVERYGRQRDAGFKRRLVGDAWIERYGALREGLLDGLANAGWRDAATCIAYDAFGPAHFARWPGWLEHSLYSTGRSSPWPLAWGGTSSSFYLFNWSGITDFTLWSPQVESMNWVFMLDEARRINPNYWFELSTWDGHEPTLANDKRKFYRGISQEFTPERYGGMIQFGMWLLRPRVVREFRGWRDTVASTRDWFKPIIDAVDRVHDDPILRDFWQNGSLLPNRAGTHPYQAIVPDEYRQIDRWFLLRTSLDPPTPWQLGTQLPVFSLALVKGSAAHREWLVYAHAPTGARPGVGITIPDYGRIAVDVPPDGAFFLVTKGKAPRLVGEKRGR